MSTVVSLIYLGPSFQKMTHHFWLHGSLRPTNLEKNLKPCLTHISVQSHNSVHFLSFTCLMSLIKDSRILHSALVVKTDICGKNRVLNENYLINHIKYQFFTNFPYSLAYRCQLNKEDPQVGPDLIGMCIPSLHH